MAKTLTEEVYDKLRNDIIQLRIKPGEKVSEAKLAKKYNVSRAPIRNVIQKLLQEELVIVKPQVGTIIMPISLKRAKDVLEVRLLLEVFAAEKAAEHISDKDLKEMESRFEALDDERLSTAERGPLLFSTDTFLHQTIWRLCGNEEITNILNNYPESVQRIRLATLELDNRLMPSRDEMFAIYQALQRRDPAAAQNAMRTHIQNIANSIEHVIKSGSE